ncbi:unnamed protein product [Cuscuta campestris]|uniref:RNA helicase n=1 Tax=Cuscuta campestris TaxID=132261 RepID=A0A484L3K5_9ASTE|nr:unnamed protein product [Cuscuta campestris]
MEEPKHKLSKRPDTEKEVEEPRRKSHHDRDDYHGHEKERNGERHKDRDRKHYRDKDSHGKEKNVEENDDDNHFGADVRDRDRKRRIEHDHKSRDPERSKKSKKLIEESEDGNPPKRSEGSLEKKQKNLEEEQVEEHRKLEDEMEKRRRRVQEWQELRRKKEESDREKLGVGVAAITEEPKSGKTWTLEGESDDEDAACEERQGVDMDVDGPAKHLDGDGGALVTNDVSDLKVAQNGGSAMDDEDIDPLDAYMNGIVLPEVEKLNTVATSFEGMERGVEDENVMSNKEKGMRKATGRIIPGENSDSDLDEVKNDEDHLEDEDDEEFMKRVKKTKAEKLSIVDHSKIDYPSFRKNFYIEVREISRMTSEEVANYRKQLELKIHGKDIPKPVKTWYQTGLSTKILDTIKKLNYERPMPIQVQSLPVIMSGRDCIGIAKTGSGKTLAFVLPMLRHIKDQPPLAPGDGPIGLVMAPTRELVQQIHSDIRKFSKVVGLSCVPVYGGSGVAQQISELKRGAEIVVCTPGRMIDILCTSGGKITNLRRVTYLVMDEADRMFDMGFEPQITRIVQNTRPDRQTVLFSATFPRQVEALARKVLNKPVEIQVGGRSVVNKDITQLVEVRPEGERFFRLLEILGEWSEIGKILIFVHTQDKYRQTVLFSATFPRQVEALARKVLNKPVEIQVGGRSVVNKDITQLVEVRPEGERFFRLLEILGEWSEIGKILIFVHTQDKCDALFKDLLKHGYPCLSLHGAKDQTDRESTIADFKSNVCHILIATSIAARGLDVKELELVINYDAPNHYEDYVHRVGRTGRAGRKGCAITFISDEDARYAPDLVKALELSEQVVPDDLKKLAEGFMAKVNQGLEQAHGTGYGGSGFKFNEEEDEVRKAAKKAQAKEYGFEEDKSDSEDEDDGIRKTGGDVSQQVAVAAALAAAAKANVPQIAVPVPPTQLQPHTGLPGPLGNILIQGNGLLMAPNDRSATTAAILAAKNLQQNLAKIQNEAIPEHFEAELEINDFPQNARWKVTHKETLGPISEWTGAAITTRGLHIPLGKSPGPGERKLYLFIEGPTEQSVKRAKVELKRVLEDLTMQATSLPGSAQPGRYSVV